MEIKIKGGGGRNFTRLDVLVTLLDIYYCFMIRKFEKTVNEFNNFFSKIPEIRQCFQH